MTEAGVDLLRSRLKDIQIALESANNSLERLRTNDIFEDNTVDDLHEMYKRIPQLVIEFDRIISILEDTRKDYL